MKKLFAVCCLLFAVCCYSNAVQITTIVNNPSNHDICLRVIDNNGNVYKDLEVTSEETEKSFDYDFELGYKYELFWKDDERIWHDFSTLPLKSATAGNPGNGSNIPYSFEELSIKNTEKPSINFEPFYLGTWSLGFNNTYYFTHGYYNNNSKYTELKYWFWDWDLFEFSVDYIGRFFVNNRFNLLFSIGENLGWTTKEKVTCQYGHYYNSDYFQKGDYYEIENTDLVFLGLQFGFGFNIVCNKHFSVGFQYKPLIWRNFNARNYPLGWEILSFFEFGKLDVNNKKLKTFMLEIGFSKLYGENDYDYGFKIGCKYNFN